MSAMTAPAIPNKLSVRFGTRPVSKAKPVSTSHKILVCRPMEGKTAPGALRQSTNAKPFQGQKNNPEGEDNNVLDGTEHAATVPPRSEHTTWAPPTMVTPTLTIA